MQAEVSATMVKLPDARETKIRTLTKLRFPDVGDPLSAHSIRRRRVSGQVSLREIEAEGYLKKLGGLSNTELDNHYQMAVEALQAEVNLKEAEQPFNQPFARANVRHWAKMSYWTPDEAVALSLGREPTAANWTTVQPLIRQSAFAIQFAARREIVMRAKVMGQLWDYNIPSFFLAWAGRMNFEVPDELKEAVNALGTIVADWKTLLDQQKKLTDAAEEHARKLEEARVADMREHSAFIEEMRRKHDELLSGYVTLLDKCRAKVETLEGQVAQDERDEPRTEARAPGTRERNSLLKLVIGMAVKGYGYDPKAGRTDAVNEIAGDLQLLGLSLSDDTVRKYLAEAKELLAGGETE